MIRLLALLLLPIAACTEVPAAMGVRPSEAPVTTFSPDPWGQEGPPRMGQVAGRIGDQPAGWSTFDFSVGAFDASAWITDEAAGGPGLRLTIIGYHSAEDRNDRVFLHAHIGGLQPGPALDGDLQIIDARPDEPRLQGAAEVVITAIGRPSPDDSYGHVAGTVTAEICPPPGEAAPCLPVQLSFDTALQFDNM